MEIKLLPVQRLDELNIIYDMTRFDNFQQIREENLRSGIEVCAVAEEKNVFVGEVSLMTQSASVPSAVISDRRNYLFGLRVLPDFQRQGIGTALVKYITSLRREQGIKEFTIAVEKDNVGARRLYERLGFKTLLENCTEMQFGRQCRFDVLILK